MSDVVMPRLSDSMEEGTILKWLKADGDEVARGEELAEIETDKATMTYEADTAGTLTIVAQEGQTLAIGEVIARIGDAGEAPASAPAQEPAEEPAAEAEPEPEPESAAAGAVQPDSATVPVAAPPEPAQEPAVESNGGRPKASPVARRIARERQIDLAGVRGTGPGGRIVKADVEAVAAGGGTAAPTAPAPAPAAPAPEPAAAPAAPPP